MKDSRQDHWRDVAEDGQDKSKIHSLRWDVYKREKEELINREFLVSVPHPKGGNIVWTYVKGNFIEENEDYAAIGLHGFDYKPSKEEQGWGVQEVLDGYPYLKHLIKLWPEYWIKQIENTNKLVGEKNHIDKSGRKKGLVCPFRRHNLWKSIG